MQLQGSNLIQIVTLIRSRPFFDIPLGNSTFFLQNMKSYWKGVVLNTHPFLNLSITFLRFPIQISTEYLTEILY